MLRCSGIFSSRKSSVFSSLNEENHEDLRRSGILSFSEENNFLHFMKKLVTLHNSVLAALRQNSKVRTSIFTNVMRSASSWLAGWLKLAKRVVDTWSSTGTYCYCSATWTVADPSRPLMKNFALTIRYHSVVIQSRGSRSVLCISNSEIRTPKSFRNRKRIFSKTYERFLNNLLLS